MFSHFKIKKTKSTEYPKQKSTGQKRLVTLFTLALLTVSMLPLFSERGNYIGKQVSKIQFEGLKNSTTGEMLSLINTQVGLPLDEDALNQDIKSLFDTGNFSNVVLRAVVDGGSVRIIFQVAELPRIHHINFQGTDHLYPTDLKTTLGFKEGDVFSLQKIKSGTQKVRKKYKEEGYFLADAWEKVSPVDTEKNTVDVTYIVDEGEDIPISKINIIGTRELDPNDIQDFIELKEESLIESGLFKEALFEQDKYKIVGFAKTRGYVDAEIDDAKSGYEIRWRNPDKPEKGRVVVVTFTLKENDIRYFGGYSADHDLLYINRELNPPELKMINPDFKPRPIFDPKRIPLITEFSPTDFGDIFDEGKFFRDRQTLQEIYSHRGYMFAQIQPVNVNFKLDQATIDRYEQCSKKSLQGVSDADRRCVEESSWIELEQMKKLYKSSPDMRGKTLRHVHFVIRENHLAYIENIIVKGMVKTQEQVIRREILVKEGQLFNSGLVNRSREVIYNLGYFKEVNLEMRPGSDDTKMNIIFSVIEQPTGTLSMGGGYGTTSGFSIFSEVGENNLNGTGQRISSRFSYGPTSRMVGVSWMEPWLYESCEATTGSFWKNKLNEFDRANNYQTIEQIAETLQNNYQSYGKEIRRFVKESPKEATTENLDRIKVRIRHLLYDFVSAEEECFRNYPRPWSLSLSLRYRTVSISPSASYSIRISDDPHDYIEPATYNVNSFETDIGISHVFFLNWRHYHVYGPSWSRAERPSSLVSNEVLKRVDLGWQFKSSLRNGITMDNRDNIYNPTQGLFTDFAITFVGQYLGGQDHYNRFDTEFKYYFWWFDYSLWGFIRKNSLRRWRVVQEFRAQGSFTAAAAPKYRKQDPEINPYIETQDRLFIGGPENLRGYNFYSPHYPFAWTDGANHMLFFSTEIRFPLEPTMLWLVAFIDAGSLFDNVGEYQGDLKESFENYNTAVESARAKATDPLTYAIQDRHAANGKRYPFDSLSDWNNPRRAVLSQRNVALDRMLYSWGVGVRVQIPVLPLRLYLAQKLYYDNGSLHKIPGDSKFEFVFGIMDMRY